jgi:hypothetical protein
MGGAGIAAGAGTTANGLRYAGDSAVVANGAPRFGDPLRTCGADDGRRFLAELISGGGSPLNFKIPFRLADITPAFPNPTSLRGGQVMVSGTVTALVVGAGDFPFDHPYGSDLNFDVDLDPEFEWTGQHNGVADGSDLHIELSAGQLPHLPGTDSGPATLEWEEMGRETRANLQTEYLPRVGSRVIVMGRFIDDCGHPPFQTELHPLSFMAWQNDTATSSEVRFMAAPAREMQLYNFDRSKANLLYDTSRGTSTFTRSFPGGLIAQILRVQDLGTDPYKSLDRMESWGLVEANKVSPAPFTFCAPGGPGAPVLSYEVNLRPGVAFTPVLDQATGCATVNVALGTQVTPNPPQRTCELPWEFLSEVAAEESGVATLDIQAELKKYVSAAYQHRLDEEPIMECYWPVSGPTADASVGEHNTVVLDELPTPYWGVVRVDRVSPSTSASTTSASTTSASATSARTTSPASPMANSGVTDVVPFGLDGPPAPTRGFATAPAASPLRAVAAFTG